MQVNLKNRKLLKEWKKIENTEIFKSLENFAEFYYANGEKFCYKKFTNEEWTKDNFFFGTYEELLEFYKTDTTISYSAQQKVGQKFHSLTVLELFAENKTGKKVIYAKCKCDCGNDTIKILRDVVKGDACTCGCRTGGKEPKVTKPLTEEIIEFWDFDKNAGIDPYKISQMSTEIFWWKDNQGNSYQLAPYVFAKEDKTHSSFPEQALFYYIKKEYSSAINRANFITVDGEVLEIDIYIPTFNIGIEYDGLFWHKDKAETDTYKSNVLFENGVYLIRIRENGLPDLNVKDFIINQSPYNSTNEREFVETINKVLDEINYRTNNTGSEKLFHENFIHNRNSIYALIYSKPVKNSIKDTCIGRLWDKERNGDLKPECVDIGLNLPIYLTCTSNKTFRFTPQYLFEKIENTKNKVFKCKTISETYVCTQNDCCPFYNLNICQGNIYCLNISDNQIPVIKCIDKNVSLLSKNVNNSLLNEYQVIGCSTPKKDIRSLLRFILFNKSGFKFEMGATEALLINKTRNVYGGGSFAEKNYCKSLLPHNHNAFSFYITDEVISNIDNGYLLVYKKLFKTVKDNFGWFIYSIILMKFDENGNIIKQANKICSKREIEKILHCNSIDEFKMLFDKILLKK